MMNLSDQSQYKVAVSGPLEETVARLNVTDTGDTWTFQFGVDGSNVGLYTVNVRKIRVEHLNFWGALEVALRELRLKQKEADEAGARLYSVAPKQKEIEGA